MYLEVVGPVQNGSFSANPKELPLNRKVAHLAFLMAALFLAESSLACSDLSPAKLNHAQIMREFGRNLLPLGKLLRTPAEDLHSSDIVLDTKTGIEKAISCAKLILDSDCEDGLMPTKLSDMAQDEIVSYKTSYTSYLEVFAHQLSLILPLLDELALESNVQVVLEAIKEHEAEAMRATREAHRRL